MLAIVGLKLFNPRNMSQQVSARTHMTHNALLAIEPQNHTGRKTQRAKFEGVFHRTPSRRHQNDILIIIYKSENVGRSSWLNPVNIEPLI